MSLGHRIKTIREQRGMSLDTLAQNSGIDPATINAVELGQQGLGHNEIMALANGLGVSIDSFFGPSEPTPTPPTATPVVPPSESSLLMPQEQLSKLLEDMND